MHGFFSLTPGEANDATVVPYVQTNRDFPALLDFMGVSQITAPGRRSSGRPVHRHAAGYCRAAAGLCRRPSRLPGFS